MSLSKRTVLHCLSTAALTLGGVGIAALDTAAHADGTCVLVTNSPSQSGNNVTAKVGRTGCTQSATWTGALKKDVPFQTDPTIASGSGSGKSSTATPSGSCKKQGGGDYYYSQVDSSTGASQRSGRKNLC